MQADGEVVGEVVAADGDDRGVGDRAFEVDDDLGGAGSDVDQADAELALVGGEGGFGGGDGLEDGLGDFEAGLVGAGDDALLGAGRTGGDVEIDFEAIADHADGVVDAGLLVEDELLREEMDDLAVGRQRDGAGAIDGGADFFAGDLAHARAEADAATAVQAADVGSADGDDAALDGGFGDVFGEGGGLVDGFDGGADFGDDSFARALGVDDAVAAIAEGSVVQLGDEDAGLASCRRRGRR